jgi:hypothetical protein
MTSKDTGLAAIARSMRSVANTKPVPTFRAAESNLSLVFDGRSRKTSLTFDVGLWDCVLETAHALGKHTRATGLGRVTISDVVEAALVAFHELPLEQKLERVGKGADSRRRSFGAFRNRREE